MTPAEKKMPEIKKAIIIGAGPAGLAAALLLTQKNGLSCTVYEVRQEPTTLGGAVGIPSNGLRLLHRLGIYERLLTLGSQTPKLELYSSRGDDLGEMDVASWSQDKTGFGYMRIKRTDLVDVLLEATEKKGIPIRFGKKIVGIEEDDNGVTATFSDGTIDTADLILGCDGIHSSVRTLQVDPSLKPEYSGLSSIGTILHTSELGSGFPTIEKSNVTITAEGLFAMFPCNQSGDQLLWFFTEETAIPSEGDTRDGWEEHSKKAVETFKSHTQEVLKDVGGEWGSTLKRVMAETKNVSFYPLFRLPLSGKWSKGRVVLVGDAAHAMQPHAGQGVSMALEDVFMLSRLLQEPDLTLSEVFIKYDEVRRPRVEKFYRLAASNGDQRTKSGPWRLWAIEMAAWAYLCVFKALGLQELGIRQRALVYDVDKEPLP